MHRPRVDPPLATAALVSLGIHLGLLAVNPPPPGGALAPTRVITARLAEVDIQEVREEPEETPPPEPPAPESLPESLPESPPVAQGPTQAPVSPPEPAPPPPTTPEPAPTIPAQAPASQTEARIPESLRPAPEPARAASPATPPASAAASAKPAEAAPQTDSPLTAPLDPTWYHAREVDRPARNLHPIRPDYPDAARDGNIEGDVKLVLKIDSLGRVLEASVVESRPPGVFDAAALTAFRQARFAPAMKDGRPVRYEATMRVTFRLD